jgi:hypothetical protein
MVTLLRAEQLDVCSGTDGARTRKTYTVKRQVVALRKSVTFASVSLFYGIRNPYGWHFN